MAAVMPAGRFLFSVHLFASRNRNLQCGFKRGVDTTCRGTNSEPCRVPGKGKGKENPESREENKNASLATADGLHELLEASGLRLLGRSCARLACGRHGALLARYRLREVLGAVLELGLG